MHYEDYKALDRFEFMLNRFNRLKHIYTMQITWFEPVQFLLNRFNRLKHLHTFQIIRFKPV